MEIKIRAVIIDDEQNCIDTLSWKIEHFCKNVDVVSTYTNPLEGLEFLNENEIDLLFLDIEMPNMSGFDLLEALNQAKFDVVFTTAYDTYGIQAVKFSALDYLLKPVRNKELTEAVEKFSMRSRVHNPNLQIENLLKNLKSQEATGKLSKITLATKESLELVDPMDIEFCESDSNYTMVHLTDKRKKLISRTLREFDEMLRPFNFVRAHNSFLINLNEVREYVKSDGGYVILKSGKQIPVSKSKKENLLSHFS